MKKKGMTLVELIVTIATASIVLLTVTATVYYVSKVSNDVVDDANNNVVVVALRDYISDNKISDNSELKIENGKIYHETSSGSQFIIDQGNILSFTIEPKKDQFYQCTISFKGSYGTDNLKFSYLVEK